MSCPPIQWKKLAMRSAYIAAAGGVASYFLLNGKEVVLLNGAGTYVPKFAIDAATLGLGSMAAGVIVPRLPWNANGAVQSGAFYTFEKAAIEPAVVAGVALISEAILAPGTLSDGGGLLKVMAFGAGATMAGNYIQSSVSGVPVGTL